MSFNSNDNKPGINLGNYEEYFILYMDNELSGEQKAMVEVFLVAHPDLQAEFDILLSTRLQPEDICLDKEPLWSHHMKLNAVDEDLLLYIDNELPAGKKKIIELELSSNQAYQQQYQDLLQTKLEAAETISYPNKKELYRRTERGIAFRPWMRIAAAVVLIGTMGVFYFTNRTTVTNQPTSVAQGGRPITQPGNLLQPNTATPVEQPAPATELPQEQVAVSVNPAAKEGEGIRKTSGGYEDKTGVHNTLQEGLAYTTGTTEEAVDLSYPRAGQTTAIDNTASINPQTASFDPKEIINTSHVTSELALRNTINATGSSVPKDDVASNNKGSFKGFLRKATRVIGRRTGIDPTSNDGEELLIGAVALKLN